MHVYWGNDWSKLADHLTANLSRETVTAPGDVFAREHCVVLPNRPLQTWLQHHVLLDSQATSSGILANIRYPMLYQFVNDWLFWMHHPNEKRDAIAHPFSVRALQWRILDALQNETTLAHAAFAPLQQYIAAAGSAPLARERRSFHLAGSLARLFDDYQVYRPDLLVAWQQGSNNELPHRETWQADLWRDLIAGPEAAETYLQAFLDMPQALPRCNIRAHHPAIHVFGISMMPQVYIACFQLLSTMLPVHLYLFNPCREQWDDLLSTAQTERLRHKLLLEGRQDDAGLLQCGNPLLANTGRGCRNFLAQILDATGGQITSAFSEPPEPETLLGRLQAAVLDNQPPPADPPPPPHQEGADNSICIHSCHSPMRELEVLRDHIYQWFDQDPNLQPRHIQVLVPDMERYAPYIDAVFTQAHAQASAAIPCAIMDRRTTGESMVQTAYQQILQLASSRFTAPELLDLLQVAPIQTRFGLEAHDMTTLTRIIADSGIRWGLDANHRKQASGTAFGEQTTWQHGLDRLLLGYAMTRDFAAPDFPLPCDRVEDATADMLGHLIRFVDAAETTTREAQTPRTPQAWAEWLKVVIDRFFARTEDTYEDIDALYRAADEIAITAGAARFERTIPMELIQDGLAATGGPGKGSPETGLSGNKVVCSALRLGAAAPRPVICLLGLGDGQFPRTANRPAYDLLRHGSRFGDPSLRTEDRAAFLEACCAARQHLYISYVGQGVRENETIPPSTLVRELTEYAEAYCPGTAIPVRHHKLHPFHPAYFGSEPQTAGFFSYDRENLEAAQAVLAPPSSGRSTVTAQAAPASPAPHLIELDDLIRFFDNPARFFFRHILKTNLQGEDRSRLADEEEFTPGGAEAWQIHSAIIAGLCTEQPSRQIYTELSEQGLAPLGAWGQTWFTEQLATIQACLERPLEPGLPTVREYLQHQEPLSDEPQETILGTIRLQGTAHGIRQPDGSVQSLDYRYATPKARDILRSWIRHLFVCSGDTPETRVSLQEKTGPSTTKRQQLSFPPLSVAEAQQHLGALIDCYRLGMVQCLPFTTEAAHAFVAASRPATASKTRRTSAPKPPLDAARSTWFSDAFTFGEDSDPYYRAAFGDAGPFHDPAFAELATTVFDPILATLAQARKEVAS